jgi:hypothetical protein
MIFRKGVVAAALLCVGCGHYIDATARNAALQSAAPSYGSVAELPFQKIEFPSDLRFSIDEQSPVFEFGDASKSDKSYVRGFELPVRDSDYQLVIRTYLLRDGLFKPAMYFAIVDLLDEQKQPIKSPLVGGWKNVYRIFSDELVYDRDRWREFTQRVTPDAHIRYVVIHTNRYQVDAGGTVRMPDGAPPQLAAATHVVPIYIPSGSNGPFTVEGSVVGDLRIYLGEIPK